MASIGPPDGHAKQRDLRGGFVHLVLALADRAAGDVLDQDGMLGRRADAFHFGCRTGEQATQVHGNSIPLATARHDLDQIQAGGHVP